MTDKKQPEALRLADALERPGYGWHSTPAQCAAELRRLHAENTTLQQGYAAARLEIESLQARIKTMAEEHADELAVAHLDGRMRAAQPAVAQQPGAAYAAPEVLDAINWVDDFIARCNGDDRGACESVTVLRRAFAAHGQAPAGASYEKELEEALRERDDADDFIDALLDEVLGTDRAEWSSAYGRADALEEVRERITALHKPAVDRAWTRFEAATAQAAPAAVAGPSEAVAYLDIGAGGYLDLGTDLTDEALSRLPKGRHALVIAGTYGIDGYIAAPTAQPAPQQEAQEAQTPAHIKAMERAWLWMENQADSQSKGGHATFNLMMLREERDALRAALDAAPIIQPAPQHQARPVTPYTCPKCSALWLHWPAEQSGFGRDTLNCRSTTHCDYCEKGGVEQLQRLERVPAVLAAPQPSPASQGDAQDAAPTGRCQHCIDRHDGVYGSWAAPCPYHDDDGKPRIDAARAAQEGK